MEPPALGLADPGPARFADDRRAKRGCGRLPTAAAADKPAQAEPVSVYSNTNVVGTLVAAALATAPGTGESPAARATVVGVEVIVRARVL